MYRNFVRMSSTNFEELLQMVAPVIQKKPTVMREPISAQDRLALIMRVLATGDSFNSLQFTFKISRQSSSRSLHSTCGGIKGLCKGAHKCSKTQAAKGPPWRILFFGTDSFSLQSLKALCSKLRTGTLISALGIVTKRHSVVCKFGEAEKIPLYFWPIKPQQIQSEYDIGMVVSFGNLITKGVLESLPLGCINVHASLLPRWRGAAPIVHAILAGDNETGITIMRVHPHKFDVGEIVRQYRIGIDLNESAEELEKRLSVHGSNLLMECIRDLPKCVQMAVPQPKTGITYAPKVNPTMAHIKWEEATAESLYNLHRAISHLYHLKTSWHGETIKLRNLSLDPRNKNPTQYSVVRSTDSQKSALDFLLNSSVTKSDLSFTSDAGKFSYAKENKVLYVTCADGHRVIISRLQVSNKVMSATDFYNGFMSKRDKHYWKFTSLTS